MSFSETMDLMLKASWMKARAVVFKDLPRLARRTTVTMAGRVCVEEGWQTIDLAQPWQADEEYHEPGPSDEWIEQHPEYLDGDGNDSDVEDGLSNWTALSNVVLAVARVMETPEDLARLVEEFRDRNKEELDDETDLEPILENSIMRTIGEDSTTCRVFRAVNQTMVFPAVGKLQETLLKDKMMVDVRGPEGWQVLIAISKQQRVVTVTHTRWMQSMNNPDSPAHYRCKWELKLSFDWEMTEMKSSFLRVLQLTVSDNMEEDERRKITKNLIGGQLIL